MHTLEKTPSGYLLYSKTGNDEHRRYYATAQAAIDAFGIIHPGETLLVVIVNGNLNEGRTR